VSSVRRNAPCPCGSGRRYKDCHGRIGEDPADVPTLVQRALAAHREGRVEDAERSYRAVLERAPGNAIATHYLGLIAWQRGDTAGAEAAMRAAIAADPTIADFHNNLGLLLRDTRRADEGVARFRRALELDPGWNEARSNLALAYETAGRLDDAIAAYRHAIDAEPRFAIAHQNLARALLTRGDFAEGWREYRWRLAAQGMAAMGPAPDAHPLPASLEGRNLLLEAEQGVGDILFFLRFAPEARRRGARLGFRGDARLHPLLERTGFFALGMHAPGASVPGDCETIAIGDLPWLLEVSDPASFPPALAVRPLPDRVARLEKALAALGPAPRIGLTWRGGVQSAGPARTQLKEVAPEALGGALRGKRATWVSLQRAPRAGEREALERSLGAPVHDFSPTNDDLEEMLALLALLDDYVGVSNANAHLRAGLGRPMQVLVAHPPEWRWGHAGERSPWFATMRAHRQTADGDWGAALAAMRAALA
jgi:Tfp pilus assembly protein PilF